MPIYLLSPRTILVVEVTIKLKNMIDDKKIETGTDGEPLIKNVKILKKL